MRLPIFFCDSIPMKDIADALAARGIHLRSDASCRMVADRVPRFLQKDEPKTNVVPMKKAKRN